MIVERVIIPVLYVAIEKKSNRFNFSSTDKKKISVFSKDIAKIIVSRQGKSASGLLTLFMKGTQIKMNFIRNNLFAKEDIWLI